MRRPTSVILLFLGCLAMPAAAHAGSILFTGSGPSSEGGVTLNAEALFTVSGSELKVTLRNIGDTSGMGKDKSANTLTGVFFDLPTGITLTPFAATIAPGDLLQASTCDLGPCSSSTTNVGGEFAYNTGTWAGHTGADRGISSSGYIGAPSGNFGGPDLDSPSAPNGINFGIVSPITASNPFKPNTGAMTDNPLIEGEVVFTMTIAGGSLLETQISNVSFQYGTDIGESHFSGTPTIVVGPPGIPEPATILLLASGLGLGVRRHRAASRRRGTGQAEALIS